MLLTEEKERKPYWSWGRRGTQRQPINLDAFRDVFKQDILGYSMNNLFAHGMFSFLYIVIKPTTDIVHCTSIKYFNMTDSSGS